MRRYSIEVDGIFNSPSSTKDTIVALLCFLLLFRSHRLVNKTVSTLTRVNIVRLWDDCCVSMMVVFSTIVPCD